MKTYFIVLYFFLHSIRIDLFIGYEASIFGRSHKKQQKILIRTGNV